MTIQTERTTFLQLLPQLLVEHPEEFAVMHNGELVALKDSFEEAYTLAVKRFGPSEDFLVSRIVEQRPEPVSLAWSAGVVVG